MGELDGIGEAVTGAMVASAVEPATGGKGGPAGGACLNCGARLDGPYCSQCGQKARVLRSLRGFFSDLVHNMFDFESKIWRTLPMLAWRPGELTRGYVEGQRARYVSPVALYLFSVFAMFAVLNFNGALDSDIRSSVEENVKQAIERQQEDLKSLEGARSRAQAKGRTLTQIDRRIASAREDLEQLKAIDSGKLVAGGDGSDNLDQAPPWVRTLVERARKNPDQLVFNIQDAASKYSWLLIPISIPFMWLLFPFRRRTHLYDHAVFVTYSLSFMMTLVIAAGLLVWAGMPAVAGFLFFVPPFHMYWQLKGAYQLGRFGTLVRTFALIVFAFIAVGLFAATVVSLGLFG